MRKIHGIRESFFAAHSLLYWSERHAVTLNFFNRNNLMTN